jgi:hypothetical protein
MSVVMNHSNGSFTNSSGIARACKHTPILFLFLLSFLHVVLGHPSHWITGSPGRSSSKSNCYTVSFTNASGSITRVNKPNPRFFMFLIDINHALMCGTRPPSMVDIRCGSQLALFPRKHMVCAQLDVSSLCKTC